MRKSFCFLLTSGFSVCFYVCFNDRQSNSPLVEVKIIVLKNLLKYCTLFQFRLISIVLNLFQACYCFLLEFPLWTDIFSLFCSLLNCPGNNSN